MIKNFIFFWFAILLSESLFAQVSAFLLQDQNGRSLIEKGDVRTRHSPCSTFKIPIALMGFDSGILHGEFHPELPYKEEYKAELPIWHVKAYPAIWTRRSIVWYSQQITKRLGREKFQNYVNQWNYGNRDLSGNPGKNDGLISSWLVSSLQISVKEQVDFLSKLLQNKLHVSREAQRRTQNILFSEELPDAWELYGKTGSGYYQDDKGLVDRNRPIGWFIGWIKKQENWYAFAHYVEDENKSVLIAGKQARSEAIDYLKDFIQKISALK